MLIYPARRGRAGARISPSTAASAGGDGKTSIVDRGPVENRGGTELWDREALDLVVPAYINFDRQGLGEMQLIAIGASIDYRLERRDGASALEFSWSGFDDLDATSGRAWARIDGDTMRGKLFIHQGDESTFVARRERGVHRVSVLTAPRPAEGARARAQRGRARRPRAQARDEVYEFRVDLLEVAPPVWRTIQAPAAYSFWDLHVAIQDAMGWLDAPGPPRREERVRPDLPDSPWLLSRRLSATLVPDDPAVDVERLAGDVPGLL